jgi:WD40 repeat protein
MDDRAGQDPGEERGTWPRPAPRPARNRLAAGAVALVVLLVIAAGALYFRNGGGVAGSPGPLATGTGLPTPRGTGLVARLSVGAGATFSWAPDGHHLLVSDEVGSRVYDRFGKLVSDFAPVEGWLDAGRLVGGDGSVVDISHSQPGASPAGSAVLANGHGSAAIVVAQPTGCGDPVVNWYRDGKYVKANESVTPLGWSPDGRYVLLGHEACDASTPATGWERQVQVVDFASGRVAVTLANVQGEIAFSPDGGSIAAQSGPDLEIGDLDTGEPETIPGARFLGWLDQESIFVAFGSRIQFVDLDPVDVSAATYAEWKASSPTGLALAGDLTGAARAIVAVNGSQLLDLSAAGLAAQPYSAADQASETYLQPGWWSPDGGMLALESTDGTFIALISVDPSRPGSWASSAP